MTRIKQRQPGESGDNWFGRDEHCMFDEDHFISCDRALIGTYHSHYIPLRGTLEVCAMAEKAESCVVVERSGPGVPSLLRIDWSPFQADGDGVIRGEHYSHTVPADGKLVIRAE